MGEYLSPGVYIEEVDRGTKPIESVGTSTAAFIGESLVGPRNEAVLCTNWSQYVKAYGDFSKSEYLATAVYGFFNNGGARCFVTNVAPEVADDKGGKKDDKKGAEKKDEAAVPAFDDKDRPKRFIGQDLGPGQRSGLNTFNDIPEVSIVAAPGILDPAIQEALIAHCELMGDRFAVCDGPKDLVGDVSKLTRPRDTQYGAVYWPWIEIYDPERGNIYAPPSGHVCGVYARTDIERGVHKAPANEIVRGALGLKYVITKAEQDLLNPKGINCIRDMGNRGIRIWGARTLSSDASWRYLNVRRLFLMVEQSIEIGTQWVVFEPNDPPCGRRCDVTSAPI